MEHFLHFWCLEVLPVCLRREVKPFIIWFYPSWLDYDVFPHKVMGCATTRSTSFLLILRSVRPGGPTINRNATGIQTSPKQYIVGQAFNVVGE
jgi:hypothetical protein